MHGSGSALATPGVYIRRGTEPDGPGSDPFSTLLIGSFPSTIGVSARTILRASVGCRSHNFGCPEPANMSNKFLTWVSSCTDFLPPKANWLAADQMFSDFYLTRSRKSNAHTNC